MNWRDYKVADTPGAVAVTGKAGDVFLFSESVVHNGALKTTEGVRTNLYFNYVHEDYNVMMREPKNSHHFLLSPECRERLNDEQKAMTSWMELVRCEH